MRIATQDSSLQQHHKEPHVFEHGHHRPHVQAPSTCPSDRQLPAPLRLTVNTLVAGPPRGGQTAWKQDGVVCAVKSGSLELSLLPEPRKWPTGEQPGLSESKSSGPCRLGSCMWGPPWLQQANLGASNT